MSQRFLGLQNKTYFPGQTILDTLYAALSCDTLLSISLIPSDLNLTRVTRPLCLNEKYIYKNISYPPGSLIRDTLYAASGCDTLLELWLQLLPLPAVSIFGDTLICEGDTTLLSTSASGSLLWSTGDTTRAIPAAPGNYSLTVTDANNCSASSSLPRGPGTATFLRHHFLRPLCSEELGSVLLKVSSGGIPPFQYALNGMTNLSGIFSSLPPGSYIATFSDALGCTRSDTVLILPPPLFEVDMTDSLILDAGSSVLVQYRLLKGSIQNILFQPGEGIALDQGGLRISATTDQIYTLTFIDDNGCEITKTLKVSVRQNNEFFAPLIFSPNNDGINDFWLPSWGSSWTRAEIKIYDRWGALMASPPATQGWDGNHHGMPCIPGVYLFHIVLYDAQGTSTSFSGDLTLVR
ncbi:MAG: T9SS type B sorting domain-containing protein [Saprospiraceae bacterium]|nr:T9SS type B sorting domain-containing protein [Candidatus Vicinibacter affinis]